MPGITANLQASVERPLALRMRPDLDCRAQRYLGRQYHVVKDPVSLRYYRFQEEEYSILRMLDGRSSLSEIQRRFQRDFAPQRVTLGELHRLVGMLFRSGLVLSDAAGQGDQLRQRHQQSERQRRWSALANLLCIRLRGIDPDRLLNRLDRSFRWLLSPAAVVTAVLLMMSALALVTVHFDEFTAKLPGFYSFFAPSNWIWLALTLAGTKLLHELGHGLACKRFGGECHEMGLMFLVFTPCLYCDVTDSWLLPSKWQRAAIGAAGMYTELVLASIATFAWWFSQPGTVHYLALNVMFVCSVSTLLFNANPLLRYDGYYILCDLIEVPNLRQKAGTAVRRLLAGWLLGLPAADDPFMPSKRRLLFCVYAVAAVAYRWFVVLAILWFLTRVFAPFDLRIVGRLLAAAVIAGMLIPPVRQLTQFIRAPERIQQVKKLRLAQCGGVPAVLLALLALVPLPHHVYCSVQVQPRGATSVYVDVPGTIRSAGARTGQVVQAGQQLLTLENLDLQSATEALRSELQLWTARLETLHQRAFHDESALLQIAEVQESIAALEDQLAKRLGELERLTVTAPTAGIVLPPPTRTSDARHQGRLPEWTGRPLEPRNSGAFLEEGVLVCQIGNPCRLEAILAVDYSQMEFIRRGQHVDIVLQPFPAKSFAGKIEQISQLDMRIAPESLSSKRGGTVVTVTDSSGQDRPLYATYQASVMLDDDTAAMVIGATGRARIRAGYQTCAARLWRLFTQTFGLQRREA